MKRFLQKLRAHNRMTAEQFEQWWFYRNGEDEAIAQYGSKVTKNDVQRQPSWILAKNRHDAFVEAVWEKSYSEMVTQ